MVDVSPQHFRKGVGSGRPRATLETRLWLTALGVVVVLILAGSWNSAQILAIQYQIEDLERDNDRFERDCSLLKAQYEFEKSPARIARLSRDMGLVSASESRVTILQGQPPARVDRGLFAANRSTLSMHE